MRANAAFSRLDALISRSGAPDRARTCDLKLRKRVAYLMSDRNGLWTPSTAQNALETDTSRHAGSSIRNDVEGQTVLVYLEAPQSARFNHAYWHVRV